MCISIGISREKLAGVEDIEIISTDHAALRHVLQHVAGDRGSVIVA